MSAYIQCPTWLSLFSFVSHRYYSNRFVVYVRLSASTTSRGAATVMLRETHSFTAAKF